MTHEWCLMLLCCLAAEWADSNDANVVLPTLTFVGTRRRRQPKPMKLIKVPALKLYTYTMFAARRRRELHIVTDIEIISWLAPLRGENNGTVGGCESEF